MEWAELHTQAQRRKIVNDEPGRVMLMIRYADAADGKSVDQLVELVQTQVVGQPWLSLWANVCPAADIELRRALVHNATLAVGSIVIDEDFYYIRHSTPLVTLTPEHLELLIELVAHEAARLRSRRVLARNLELTGQTASPYAD